MDPQPPVGAPPGAPPLPSLPVDLPIPHISVLADSDKPLRERLRIVKAQFKDLFSGIFTIFWLPFSWFLTFAHSAARLFKFIMLLPLTIFVNIYERRIRAKFPMLPSIWLIMNVLFPGGFRLPSFRNITDLPGTLLNGNPLKGQMPTLDVDLSAIAQGASGDIASSISNAQNAASQGLSKLSGFGGLANFGGAKSD